MKQKFFAAALFVVVFIGVYLFICFGIPGMRIKLEAEPMEYFLRSIGHMAFFKTLVSMITALIADAIMLVVRKKG